MVSNVTAATYKDCNEASLPGCKRMLKSIISNGHLTIVDWRGRKSSFGDVASDLRAILRFHDRFLAWKIVLNPSLALGEAYMDGRLTIESGSLRNFLAIVGSNLRALDSSPLLRLLEKLSQLRGWARGNHKSGAQANVAHHYDLSGDLYSLFLDADRQYSCAYFVTGEESLEDAQTAKKRHLAAKLRLGPGMRVLDIGCGWGGLALDLAKNADVGVCGITLSKEQLGVAKARAEAGGSVRNVSFDLLDYRDVAERYDRIVSVGMFEHVGPAHYRQFFSTIARALEPDGVAVIHTIGRRSPPGGADPWISKYIFPGGYIPAISEVTAAVEKSGLWATDIEILPLHYAETLRHWYKRFQVNRHLARELYDERFCRMWEFYLAGCEMLFRQGDLTVFQIQLTHKRKVMPPTRDYITDYDRKDVNATHPKGPVRDPIPPKRRLEGAIPTC